MSFAVTGVVIAGASLAYGVYSSEKAAGAQRDAQYKADKEQARLDQLDKDQKARLEATALRDKMKLQQRSATAQNLTNPSTVQGDPGLGMTIGSSYKGKTLIGG